MSESQTDNTNNKQSFINITFNKYFRVIHSFFTLQSFKRLDSTNFLPEKMRMLYSEITEPAKIY
jgi:hypothetical protein